MLEEPSHFCSMCEEQLTPIKGTRCDLCSRSMNELPIHYIVENVCLDCYRWEQHPELLLEKNHSVYEYNDFLKDLISTFKFRGDAAMGIFFAEKVKNEYKNHFSSYVPLAMPLSDQRLLGRGFNQSRLLMQGWTSCPEWLIRKEGEKQSKKSRKQRIHEVSHTPFSLKEHANVVGQQIVLIDDVYTTGTTVRQAARVLLNHGALKVASLTIAR